MVRFSIVKRLKYIQNKAINKRQQEIDMNRKEKEKIPKPLVFMGFERVAKTTKNKIKTGKKEKQKTQTQLKINHKKIEVKSVKKSEKRVDKRQKKDALKKTAKKIKKGQENRN